MTTKLDINKLRALEPAESARFLRQKISSSSVEAVTQKLLQAVETNSIPPRVFAVWLDVSRSPFAIKHALQQNFSIAIRKKGIKFLREALNSAQWREVWDVLGDTPGVLALLAELSVQDVKAICTVIGRFAKGQDVEEKRKKGTELMEAMYPTRFPDAVYQTTDKRPLAAHTDSLISACTPQRVEEITNRTGSWKNIRTRDLLRYQYDTLRNAATKSILGGTGVPSWAWSLYSDSPSAQGISTGFSASMQFSIETLRMLVEEKVSEFPDKTFVSGLVEPLLRRAMRKRVKWEKQQEIVDLTVKYLERRPAAAKRLELRYRSLLYFVAQCWSRKSEMFEKQFKSLIWYIHNEKSAADISKVMCLLRGIPKSRRYALLRFWYLEVTHRDIDVEEDLVLVISKLPYDLLCQLEDREAWGLFTRLRNAKGDNRLIGSGPYDSVACIAATHTGSDGDTDLVNVLLLHRCGEVEDAEALAKVHVQDRKKRAMACSDQHQRAWYAQSAIYYATASRSFEQLKDVYIWARRFVRDPATIPLLYNHYTIEAQDLLSGMPAKISDNFNLASLRPRIEAANAILWILFETVCLALREPSFNPSFWRGTLSLFFQIVQARRQRSAYLKGHKYTKDKIYDVIWKDTLRMLMDVEDMCLKPGHEGLGVKTLGGILAFQSYRDLELKDELPSTYHFFDNLARARDELWRKVRPTLHPDAAILPEPYPRGLPIQHLIGKYYPTVPNLEKEAPYLAARANSIVFIDPKTASQPFPAEKDTIAAIGCFVDDYNYALRAIIPKTLSPKEKRSRFDQAWTHAIGPVSKLRMSRDEAIRYWKSRVRDDVRYEMWEYFSDAYATGSQAVEWPKVPVVEDPTEAEEWNPLPPKRPDIKPRTLDRLTYIDVAINSSALGSGPRDYNDRIKESTPEIPGQTFEDSEVWSLSHEYSRIEAQILSVLLFLDSPNSAKTRILSTPFPAEGEYRYPAVYLDEEFLSSKGIVGYVNPNGPLEAHIEDVPPNLLAQVVANTLSSLGMADPTKSDTITLENKAFRLLKLLGESDRPSLATGLAVRTIIERPNASSWHRLLLSPRLFLRLSASDARACFTAFANAILAKLEEQAEANKRAKGKAKDSSGQEKATEDGAKAPQQPYVKITTVKFLAQLLRDSRFVSRDFAVEVLSTLAQKTSHVDIRKAVVDSLLAMLGTSPPGLVKEILACLSALVPMIGTLDERRPFSEADWVAAQEAPGGPVPPEIDVVSIYDAPLLESVLNFLRTTTSKTPLMCAFTSTIVLPVVSRLKGEMKKWLEIFLASISAPANLIDHLPLVPRHPDVWTTLLSENWRFLPVSVLEEYVQYQMFCIKPHPEIAAINKSLDADPKMRSRPSVQAWLYMYNPGLDILKRSPNFSLPSLLGPATAKIEDGITEEDIQGQFLDLFTVTLWKDSARYGYVEELMKHLRPSKFDRTWMKHKRPLVEAVIAYINTLRTREWENDAARQPAVLPDTFRYRLWLLKYPRSHGLEGDVETQCKVYAKQVGALVDGEVSMKLYHKKLEKIKRSFQYVSGSDRVLVAEHLGDMSTTRLSWLTLKDLLRVELAVELLRGVKWKEVGKEHRGRAAELLDQWKRSENEEVRRWGFTVVLG